MGGVVGGSELVDEAEDLALGDPAGATDAGGVGDHASPEVLALYEIIGLGDPVGGDELGAMGQERIDLQVGESGDVLDVVRLLGLEQQQRIGAVVRKVEMREEVRIAGRHNGVEAQPCDGRDGVDTSSTGRG